MKKYKKVTVNGVKLVEKIEKDPNRPKRNRPAVFKMKTDYDRNKARKETRREAKEWAG